MPVAGLMRRGARGNNGKSRECDQRPELYIRRSNMIGMRLPPAAHPIHKTFAQLHRHSDAIDIALD